MGGSVTSCHLHRDVQPLIVGALQSLSMLQDRLPSFPTPVAMAVMEEELRMPVLEVYSELSEAPVAAASLGQASSALARQVTTRNADLVCQKGG